LVSFNEKHNDANGEENRDGADYNESWNCGAEGVTADDAINVLRAKQQRNLMATLLLSQGTPMISGGDELGRSQAGNNNAYCQDNELSWYDWQHADSAFLAFTKKLIEIRRAHPALHRAKFFKGRRIRGTSSRDLLWFRHDGVVMTDEDWNNPQTASIGVFLGGRGIDDVDEQGNVIIDDDLFLVINGSPIELPFKVPALASDATEWELLVDTGDDKAQERLASGKETHLEPRTLKLFKRAAVGERLTVTP
jgi:glycogen operon protein